MPIARFFARATLILVITCALVTGAAYGLGKAAPQDAGVIYFMTENSHYIFDPLYRTSYNLTRHQAIFEAPLPSHDGAKVAFVQFVDDSPEVHIFDFNTGQTTSIYRQPQDVRGVLQVLSWSPSGRYLAFSSARTLFKHEFSTGETTAIIDEERRRMLNDANPVWSPDESRIAFSSASRQTDYWQIYLVNADGEGLRRITYTDVCALYRAYWSPTNANMIVIDGACDLISTTFLLNADTQSLTPLSNFNVRTWTPKWSPDGSKIIFGAATTAQNSSLYIIDLTTLETRYITDGTGAEWSPDGETIVFRGLNNDLYMINTDGGNLRRLTFYNNEQFVYPLAWSR